MTSPKVIAIIPAYNEAATIGEVVAGLLPCVSEVVVVDDASSDGTGDIARAAGAHVVSHAANTGYDATVNDGFAEAARRGADILLTFDADGEHDPADAPKFIKAIEDGADLAIGIRPHTRHWSEDVFSLYMRLRFGLRDAVCGLKAYRRAVYDEVGFFDSLHSIGTELMVRGLKNGHRAVLIPIMLRSRPDGDSSRFYSMNLRGNLRVLRALWRILWI